MTPLQNNWFVESKYQMWLGKKVEKLPTLYFRHIPCHEGTYILNYLLAPGSVQCFKCNDRFTINKEQFEILKFAS